MVLCLEVLLSEEENCDLHRRCVEQYDHLRDEFERYKLRAQSVLKNKSSPAPKVHLSLMVVFVLPYGHFMLHVACKLEKYNSTMCLFAGGRIIWTVDR